MEKTLPHPESQLWTNEKLVEECQAGNQQAWAILVDQHKKLVYSVVLHFGLSGDDAKEVFQEVFLSFLEELPHFREPRALPAWLARTAWHKCLHWRRIQRRHTSNAVSLEAEALQDHAALPDRILRQVESEQLFRETLATLPDRCVQLIRMLFFETPARPYQQVAKSLGLSIGSIGFIRMRCLERLKKRLQEGGFA